MVAKLSGDEMLVRDWLCQRGYPEPEYEPDVGAGKRPDFFAATGQMGVSPSSLWAEVKSLQPENTKLLLDRTWPVLKQLGVPAGLNGHAMLHVTDITREQSVRALVKMFHRNGANFASERIRLIFIQQMPEMKDVRTVSVSGVLSERIWARGTGNSKIAVPAGTIENAQATATWEVGEATRSAPVYKVFDWLTGFDCALVVEIDPEDRPLTSISSMSGGNSTVSQRAVNAIETANSQVRRAYRFKPAAGVVFIVPAEEHADDLAIATAVYGKLTVPVPLVTPRSRDKRLGEAFYGHDGAFRPGKNTHISVVVRLRSNGEVATYFPNPFAREPIDESASLLQGLRRAPVTFA